MKIKKTGLFFLIFPILIAGCSTQQNVVQTTSQAQKPPTNGYSNEQQVLKRKVAIARFSNETQYAKGIFYDKENDPIGSQALDILSTKLVSSNKFILLERNDIDKIMDEMELSGSDSYQKIGADYLIIGSVTEYGRKNIGDVNVFSRSKTQVVEAGVSLRLIDVFTGQIIYSEEAKGQAETSNQTVLGLGERTSYDATLSDKAISAAISKLVENVINNLLERPWKSYFLAYDENGIFIAGGEDQGVKEGDVFLIEKRGKKVKNPQTGMMMELPGKVAGKIKVEYTGGDDPQNQFSLVTIIEGKIDKDQLQEYYIKEDEK